MFCAVIWFGTWKAHLWIRAESYKQAMAMAKVKAQGGRVIKVVKMEKGARYA